MGVPVVDLPRAIRACLFDLDGVLANTASVHAEAWKETFEELLGTRPGDESTPFDPVRDYARYIDGKPRSEAVRSFLASRGISLPEGAPDDSTGELTVAKLGNRANELVLAKIRGRAVQPYQGSVRFVLASRDAGLRRAVVSSSINGREVLHAAGIAGLFEARVDAATAREGHLRGKPAPDMLLAAARIVGVPPHATAVFEDAPAGVAAARAGGFGLVVGVDRGGRAEALRAGGADAVVSDLSELLATGRSASTLQPV